eukprot:SAG31_NODE_736_length_12477_cov_60.959363_13_plen_265_part_00
MHHSLHDASLSLLTASCVRHNRSVLRCHLSSIVPELEHAPPLEIKPCHHRFLCGVFLAVLYLLMKYTGCAGPRQSLEFVSTVCCLSTRSPTCPGCIELSAIPRSPYRAFGGSSIRSCVSFRSGYCFLKAIGSKKSDDQLIEAGENLKNNVWRCRLPSAGDHGSVPCVVASVNTIAEPAVTTPPVNSGMPIPTIGGPHLASKSRHSRGIGNAALCDPGTAACTRSVSIAVGTKSWHTLSDAARNHATVHSSRTYAEATVAGMNVP